MISYSCDWCSRTKHGYTENGCSPCPGSWWRRRHVVRDADGASCESELLACSEACRQGLDSRLNAPHGVNRWWVDGDVSSISSNVTVETDDAKPITPLRGREPCYWGPLSLLLEVARSAEAPVHSAPGSAPGE